MVHSILGPIGRQLERAHTLCSAHIESFLNCVWYDTWNPIAWEAKVGGSNILAHPGQHSKSPTTAPKGFVLLVLNGSTGHDIKTACVLGE